MRSHKCIHNKSKIDKSQKDDIKFVIAGKNTAKTLDAAKKPLNLVALFVQFLIVVPTAMRIMVRIYIYFHCAKTGHKLDAIKGNNKASFCVVDKDEVIPEEYTSYFRSVIVFGTIRIIENEQEKRDAIEKLALKYAPDDITDHRKAAIDREWGPLCMLEMTIEHLTGKEAIELVQAKSPKQ